MPILHLSKVELPARARKLTSCGMALKQLTQEAELSKNDVTQSSSSPGGKVQSSRTLVSWAPLPPSWMNIASWNKTIQSKKRTKGLFAKKKTNRTKEKNEKTAEERRLQFTSC